jgi:aspartyl-tRNA(Asn)/glutamyl-tRNA(Gln) amidotransferase subunit A
MAKTLLPPLRLSGAPLRALARLAESRPVAAALKRTFAAQLGIDRLAALGEMARGTLPSEARPLPGRAPRVVESAELPVPMPQATWPRTAGALAGRYREKKLTPRAVVEAALADAAMMKQSPFLALDEAVARREADASTRRWAAGTPRGPLDGIPLVVKEETNVAGLPTRVGTAFLPATPAPSDATIVARLRAAGMIVLGSTVMTELGLSPLGVNPHRAMPRNPHHPHRVAGGSSTGSAVAVATGLAPIAIAADGGGSIRIPSSLCGVFGLKPTFGRVSRAGDFYGGTVNHLGPIAASAADLAAFLEACAGPDENDPITANGPALSGSISAAVGRGVRGLRIGVLESLWEGAVPSVANAGRGALAALEKAGATLVPVSIELALVSASIGYLTIGLEELTDVVEVRRARRDLFGPDVAVTLSSLSAFGPTDYLDAQRLRARLREQTAAAFREIDLLALPGPAPAVAITDAEAASGILDPIALDGVCRPMFMGNLTGFPGGVAPIGRDSDGLPLSVQLMGDAWDEATVVAALAQLERDGAATVLPPAVRTAGPAGY